MNSEALTTSAGRWFRAGLAAYVTDPPDLDFAVHHFGVAIEHLLKAYLSSIHPSLIVDGKDFNSLLHAVGQGAHAKVPITRINTIGLRVAYDRCKHLLTPRLTMDDKTFQLICDGRNGVAHSGIHAPANAQAILEACIRTADPILDALAPNEDPQNYFWHEFTPLHDHIAQEQADALRMAVNLKLAKALTEYRERFLSEPEEQRDLLIKAIQEVQPLAQYRASARVPCPVCPAHAWVGGSVDFEWREIEELPKTSDTGSVTVVEPVGYIVPEALACSVCGLRLEEAELPEVERHAPVEADVPWDLLFEERVDDQ